MVPHAFACRVLICLVSQVITFNDRGEQVSLVSHGYFETAQKMKFSIKDFFSK